MSKIPETSAPLTPLLAARWSPRSYDKNYEISDQELLSILEDVSAIGAPVPGFMQALLKKLKVHTEDTAEENLPGEENSDE